MKRFILTGVLVLAVVAACSAEAAQVSLTGLWHEMNMVGSGFSERYAFYEDGSFIYCHSQMDGLERNLCKTGTWSVADDELQLTIETRLVLEGGEVEESDEGQYIDGADVRELLCDPPEKEVHKIADAGKDEDTEREMITIGGVVYYRFDNQTDLMDDYYELKDMVKR